MFTGMMWFDNDQKTALDEKVRQAVEYYRSKYGRQPDTCFVNPQQLLGVEALQVGGLSVCSNRVVLPGHFWIGVAEQRVGT